MSKLFGAAIRVARASADAIRGGLAMSLAWAQRWQQTLITLAIAALAYHGVMVQSEATLIAGEKQSQATIAAVERQLTAQREHDQAEVDNRRAALARALQRDLSVVLSKTLAFRDVLKTPPPQVREDRDEYVNLYMVRMPPTLAAGPELLGLLDERSQSLIDTVSSSVRVYGENMENLRNCPESITEVVDDPRHIYEQAQELYNDLSRYIRPLTPTPAAPRGA